MTDPPRTIALSLISHTNVGKTTLARTLLGRDIGVVRDEAHVTESADEHTLIETPAGDRLALWDTPGFGDSARLAKRLASMGDPLGWFLTEVWDRFRDRAFWSSQQAVRNVRDQADIVLYLVNASETPAEAGYVASEMRVLDWIGKPVVVLLNQLGPPQPAAAEAADLQAWRSHLAGARQVRAVLPLDAFARCWVQEATLLRALLPLVSDERRRSLERLIDAWLQQRREIFESSIAVLAQRIAVAATDSETLAESGVGGLLRDAGSALLGSRRKPARQSDTGADGDAGATGETARPAAAGGAAAPAIAPDETVPSSARQAGMRALAERLDADIRAGTDRLIALHGLDGRASGEILARLAEHYVVDAQLSERKAAVFGGALTGALAGLKADLATGGLSFGAGLLAGGVLGALGAFGLARGYNVARGLRTSTIGWSNSMLDELVITALLGYLAVAHYGRGRGDWTASEYPPHWRDVAESTVQARRDAFEHAWSLRGESDAREAIERALEPELRDAALEILDRLYPGAYRR